MAQALSPSDRFRRLRLLGEGGSGRVWLVEDRHQPGTKFALKELAESARGKEELFRREFATLATLRHPNLAEVYEFDVSARTGLAEFTLEYVDGLDLVQAVRDEGPQLLLDLAAEALRALSFLHDFGLVHRDLKPGNLLVRREQKVNGRLVVLDFGLALQGKTQIRDQTAAPAGTLPYMAPELFSGAGADRRTDVYALGVLLYEAIHGKPPYEPDPNDIAGFINRVTHGKRSRPEFPSDYPVGLSRWIDAMIAPEAADRPGRASEALARLNAACGTDYEIETRETRAARLSSGAPPGREELLQQLWSYVTDPQGPRIVWIAGDAGTGKSRILRWLGSEAVRHGREVTWQVVIGDEENGTETHSNDETQSIASTPGKSEALRKIVIVDELESAGARQVHVLDRVAREIGGSNARIVAALRPSEITNDALRTLLNDSDLLPNVKRIDLGSLDRSSVRHVVERAMGGEGVSPQQVRWLHEASEGNPLILESLITEGVWERGQRSLRSRTIDQSIQARLERLSGGGRRWLNALSVFGGGTPAVWIDQVSGVSTNEARSAQEEVKDLGLASLRQRQWSPSSRLVAECVMRSLDPEERGTLRRRAAELLEKLDVAGSDPGRLAKLWAGAGERDAARHRAIEAADRADREGQPAEAANWIRLALLQLDRPDPARLELRHRHADLLIRSGQQHLAYRALATCLRLTRSPVERAELMSTQAQTLVALSRFKEALAVANSSRSIAIDAGAQRIAAKCTRAMGMAMFRLGLFEEAIEILDKGAEEHAKFDNREEYYECIYLAGICESRLRRFEEAKARFMQVKSFAASAGCHRLQANTLVSLGNVEGRLWNHSEAAAWYEEARNLLSSHHELMRQHVSTLANLSQSLWARGRLDQALDVAQEGENLALRIGSKTWLLTCSLAKSNALADAGRPAEAAAVLDGVFKKTGDLESDNLGFAKLSLASALLESAEPDFERITGLIQGVLDDEGQQARLRLGALLLQMERSAYWESGDPFGRWYEQFEDLMVIHRKALDPPLLARADLVKTRHLIDSGDLGAAEKLAAATATFAEEKELPDYAARAYALLAEIQRKTGRSAEAGRSLVTGRRLLDEAALRIEDESMRRDYLDRRVFRALRQSSAGPTTGEERLLAIYDMIRALNSETDPELVLESTLDMALKVVRAERGMVLLREDGDAYRVRVARNLEQETIRDASEFSRNVVLQAGTGKAVLAVDTGQDERLRELKSVSMYGIRSVLCVPLRSRGKIIGAVYLDNRSDASLFSPDDLRFLEAFADQAALALENAQIRRELELENQRLQQAAESRVQFGNIVGRSPPMQQVYGLINKVADNSLPVLIVGESGTGKELVARAIHFNGPRRRKPFVTENCAAIPETLLESELFGHVRGAFTGAERDRAGLFEQAHGGTLMLDEVGDMSAAMQARLLRAVQEGEIRRVGGERWAKVDVRLIAATHRDLDKEVREGRFREDLLYRLQVLVIPVPPLRERTEDIPPLVDHFLQKIARERDRPVAKLRTAVMDLLERYRWPGNIRQLENTLQRLTLLAGDAPITIGVVESDRELRRTLIGETEDEKPVFSLERSEEQQIREALRAAGGNRTKAAKMLGISRATIFRKIKQFGLS